jgi:hypothetical protein
VIIAVKKHWWSNGVDMQEHLALFFTAIWGGVVAIFSAKSYFIGLDTADNEFFWSVSWPTIIAAASYYGVKLVLNLGARKFTNKLAEPEVEQLPEPPEGDNWRDYV